MYVYVCTHLDMHTIEVKPRGHYAQVCKRQVWRFRSAPVQPGCIGRPPPLASQPRVLPTRCFSSALPLSQAASSRLGSPGRLLGSQRPLPQLPLPSSRWSWPVGRCALRRCLHRSVRQPGGARHFSSGPSAPAWWVEQALSWLSCSSAAAGQRSTDL